MIIHYELWMIIYMKFNISNQSEHQQVEPCNKVKNTSRRGHQKYPIIDSVIVVRI